MNWQCSKCEFRYTSYTTDCPSCTHTIAKLPGDSAGIAVSVDGVELVLGTNTYGFGKGTFVSEALPMATSVHPVEAGATIELPSQPVQDLAARVAQAVFSDEAEEGCDNQIGIGLPGPRFSAILVEMAGYEAEAYALQDQVDEANASVTAMEQRLAEAEKLLKEVHRGVRHEGWVVCFTIPGRIEAWLAAK